MMKRKGQEVRTKILLIGENPDIQLFTALQKEGYEAIVSESPEKPGPVMHSALFDHRPPAHQVE
jgi:hypothetical protein